jgi:hypothetical protein
MDHLDKNECVYKLSSSVKTNRGVGKIAMTQKRLFLLTEGRPGYVEISTFRNIEVSAQGQLWSPARWPPFSCLCVPICKVRIAWCLSVWAVVRRGQAKCARA